MGLRLGFCGDSGLVDTVYAGNVDSGDGGEEGGLIRGREGGVEFEEVGLVVLGEVGEGFVVGRGGHFRVVEVYIVYAGD